MTEVFLKVVNMSISAGWLVLAVLILRQVLKKGPKWVNVVLWGIVAVRLICPFSLESVLSLIPSAQTIPVNIALDPTPAIDSGISTINGIVNPILSQSNTPAAGASVNPLQITIGILANIWILGVLAMLIYTIVSYWRLARRVDTAVLLRDNLFRSEYVGSPFVLGIRKPKIYLPSHMEEPELSHVVAHEQAHIRRRDHWWKPLGFLLLTIHWFNPVMWIAYVLLCRDIELACDEKVIAGLDHEQRADYTQALVSCGTGRRMGAPCPLAFGEVGVKQRVKNVLHYRRPGFWVVLIAVLLCAAVAVCFLTDPVTPSMEVLPEIHSHSYGVVEVVYETQNISYSMVPQENTPVYAVTTEMKLLSKGGYTGEDTWTQLGTLTEFQLTKEEFDERFFFESGWRDGETAASVRRNTARAWRLVYDQDVLYYLLQWKNGEMFLVHGYYDHTEKNDPGSDDTAIGWLYRLAVDLNEEFNVVARSGDNLVPVTIFPAGTAIGNYSRAVHWLTIDPGEDLVPFRVYRDGEELYGHFFAFDAETCEPLEYSVPSGLEPQTRLFQNADPERAYIVTMQSAQPDSPVFCFGVRFADTAGYFNEMLTDLRPMILVNGQIYLDTGETVPAEIDPSAVLGRIGSSVSGDQRPAEEGQSNFGCVGSDYARFQDGILVLIDQEWYYFEPEQDEEVSCYLTIGTEGVYSIEITGPHSSGGCTNADGSPFRMGERVWLEPMDGITDLRSYTISALGEEGNSIFSVRISDHYDPENPDEPIVCGDWVITPMR